MNGNDKDRKLEPTCALCAKKICFPRIKADEKPTLDEAPPFCPMKTMPEAIEKSLAEYDKPEVREFARLASIQEAECYERLPEGGIRTKIPRVEELIQFAQKCGYKKLGIAFCEGLAEESRILHDILTNRSFEVVSVRCKVGAIAKERIGIKPEEKIVRPDRYESMCSPITQAEVMNEANVDLAIMLGLCIGHDTLFIKYCRVPMTVIAVKDRVFGHNPLAALYLSKSPYYGRLMRPPKKVGC
jgi:uncharacterized metal-binding protein